MDRVAAFVSYSFEAVPEYAGLLGMMERQGLAIVNRSVHAWDPLDATGADLNAALEHRIKTSSRVIVLATEDLHKRPCVSFEIETARKYAKPIIAIYPNGEFGRPIPRALNDGLYRAVGWRGNALEKAIRGEYPPESRVFDLAEDADRRQLLCLGAAASAGVALLVAGATQERVAVLRQELASRGVIVTPIPKSPYLMRGVLGGAAIGALFGAIFGGKGWDLLAAASAGGAAGAGVGLVQHANAELRRLGALLELRRLDTTPMGVP